MTRKFDTDTELNNRKAAGESCSCRFCATGIGKHVVNDKAKKEIFWLCDKHKVLYDIVNDKVGV